MSHQPSLYRVCGPALIAGALLLLFAFALKPPQPATLETAAELGLATWVLANWLFVFGAVLLLGGWIGLTAHLNQTLGEGWSTLGLGAVVIGCVGIAIAAAINAEALPQLLHVFSDERRQFAIDSYFSMELTMGALGLMAWTIFWVGIAISSLAIGEDVEFSQALGLTGLIVALAEIASQLLPEGSLARDAISIMGCLWLVVVGTIFFRIERATTPAHQEILVAAHMG
jgi:hypothetical protein